MQCLLHPGAGVLRRRPLLLLLLLPGAAAPAAECLVIAHRGASGYLPEHTLPAYRLGALLGADYLEPDLVLTKDGVLVARHEAGLGATTDVATRPEFAGRRRVRRVAGEATDDWWSDDFTLAELRTLRARERIPELRPGNARFDGAFAVPTFAEILDLRAEISRELGRPVGVYPELKSPALFRAGGLDPEAALAAELTARGLAGRDAPVIVQSFDPDSLRRLRDRVAVRRVQLLPLEGDPDAPPPLPALRDVADYADGIGVARALLIAPDGRSQPLARAAGAAGLFVHAWTFRRETVRGDPPPAGAPLPTRAEAIADIRRYLELGIDGIFTDQPDLGVAACGR
jgi:glycerophosphoryl diester phosphodiesterase